VPGHDFYEGIAAAASRGEASADELAAFEEHARECAACRAAYAAVLQFAALEFAVSREQGLAANGHAPGDVDSERLTRAFFERVAREGVQFAATPPAGQAVEPWARSASPGRAWMPQALRLAAMLVVGVALGAVFTGWIQTRAARPQPETRASAIAPDDRQSEIGRLSGELQRSRAETQAAAAELALARERNQQAEARYQQLRQQASQLQLALTTARADVAAAQQDLDGYRARVTTAETTLAASQARLNELQPLAREANAAQERARAAEATLADARTRVDDLARQVQASNDALERQRELMALGRDVTDLMGARNLHIIDVVDTDAQGRNRQAFGRVFFTENKSLVFYAFDLNDPRVVRADFEYRVWARKEAEPQRAQSLGIFYVDNAAQRRWVFKCSDPKVLSEIDSVFVTLEPKDSKRANPNGAKMLYAYLRGQPNHQ
jgi:hypothetical protein